MMVLIIMMILIVVVILIVVILVFVVILIVMIVIVVSPNKASRKQHGDCAQQDRQLQCRPFLILVHARKIRGTVAE